MFLVALAVAPGIFWLWYFLARDRMRPEPFHLLGRVFVLGAGGAFVAGVVELAVFGVTGITLESGRAAQVVAAAAVIGLIEEVTKFLPVYLGVYRHVEFNEVMDGIIYAVAAALGFATVENLYYVLAGGTGVGVARALLAVPGHAFFGALLGFNMGMAKFAGPRETAWLLTGIGLAATAHTVYDALVLSRGALALAVIPLVLFLWRRAVFLSRRAQSEDSRRLGGA